jgi:dTDP-4-dehydrorhamnose reductase
MRKLLITGGSGLLGGNIAKLAKSEFKVYATYHQNKVSMNGIRFFPLDLTKKTECVFIEDLKPDIIIHCAALTNVDFCESNPDFAYKQNVISSMNVATIANKIGSYMIHMSTDSVFDGKKGNYDENDPPKPINVYSKTKLQAEEKVLSISPETCIIRTNLFGWNKRRKFSLAEWMINKLQNKEKLPGLKDVYFAPMLVNDLTEKLFKLYDVNYHGIINMGSSECCSKLNFAYEIAEIFELNPDLIEPIKLDKLRLNASRPNNTCLNVSKAEEILDEAMPTVKDGLVHMKNLFDQGYVKELKYG